MDLLSPGLLSVVGPAVKRSLLHFLMTRMSSLLSARPLKCTFFCYSSVCSALFILNCAFVIFLHTFSVFSLSCELRFCWSLFWKAQKVIMSWWVKGERLVVHIAVSIMSYTGHMTTLESQEWNWSHQISCHAVGNRKAQRPLVFGGQWSITFNHMGATYSCHMPYIPYML